MVKNGLFLRKKEKEKRATDFEKRDQKFKKRSKTNKIEDFELHCC
jgi:hypothetical protein